jgi:hypothetical protein
MAIITVQQPSFIVDSESERSTSWPNGSEVYCKDTKKTYRLESSVFEPVASGTGSESDPVYTTSATSGVVKTAYDHSQVAHAPSDATTLATVKLDSDIASAISLKHSNSLDHSQHTDTGTSSANFAINGSNAIKEGDARLTDERTPAAHSQAETTITFTDLTTGDASTSNHGFFPKLPAPTGKYLKDNLTWDSPAGGSGLTQPQVLARTFLRC